MFGHVDHVTVAWHDLDPLADAFADANLEPEYGGPHDNGATHMSVVGFDDGSYVELISTLPEVAGGESPLWPWAIEGDAGPCAWAVGVDDVAGATKRAIDAGLRVDGPRYMARETDAGLAEWDLAFVGGGRGRRHPFVIADRTPRERRIRPTPCVAGGPLSGIEEVVLGVEDLGAAVESFERVYRYPTPDRATGRSGRLASFPGRPVTLAAPGGEGDLADRLERFGPAPRAFLFGTDDLGAARKRHPLGGEREWFGRRLAWFDVDPLCGWLGVVERGP